MKDELIIYTDGGSRGNPGEAAYAFVIFSEGEKVSETGKRIGINTNNVAEYTAVLKSLEWVAQNFSSVKLINYYVDSELVVKQLSGLYKIKNENLKKIVEKIREYEKTVAEKIIYNSIPREKNKTADLLVNRALNNEL